MPLVRAENPFQLHRPHPPRFRTPIDLSSLTGPGTVIQNGTSATNSHETLHIETQKVDPPRQIPGSNLVGCTTRGGKACRTETWCSASRHEEGLDSKEVVVRSILRSESSIDAIRPASAAGHHDNVRIARKSDSHFTIIRGAGCLTAVTLLLLTACTPLKVKLGWKVYLDQIPVKSMEASQAKGPGISPGEKSPLVVTFVEPDGKILRTEGAGRGKVLWKDLKVEATVATVNTKGVLRLSRDPRKSDGKTPHVIITVPSHPDLRAELDIPVRYDRAFSASFNGSRGFSGTNGTDGIDGTSGTMGSIDPNNPSPGGNGGDGTDGSNGGDGGAGGDAPPVDVKVALRSGSHPLLQVSVSAAGRQKLYLIDPQGGSLTVTADGGAGGSGGRGGRGGRGGSGGIGTPNGNSGRNGSDGRSGWDGRSGRGGPITVTYDPQVKPYLGAIHASSHNGPKPAFVEATVAALW